MKYIQTLLFILVTCLTTSAQLVVQVYDGDTYKILDHGKLQVIRLANVDAPELNQYYGTVVKAGVSKLILGCDVKIDPVSKDRYGRMIAGVTVDGMRLDSLLIVKGWAWNYTQFSQNYKLSNYEKVAKAARVGIWRCLFNVPPWEWRKLNKKQKRLHEMCR
jgi:endonuclease YncB( thermonuclease family)